MPNTTGAHRKRETEGRERETATETSTGDYLAATGTTLDLQTLGTLGYEHWCYNLRAGRLGDLRYCNGNSYD